jgi:hypothetical protein
MGLTVRARVAARRRGSVPSGRLSVRLASLPLLAAVLALVWSAVATAQGPGAGRGLDLLARAQAYENGESVERSYGKALSLYCQAAQQGSPQAFLNIGWMYLNGRGVPRDESVAVVWLHKASQHGVPQAHNLLKLLSQVSPARNGGCTRPGDGSAAAGLARLLPPPPQIRALIDETARQVGLDARLLQTVMAVESGYNPRAVSPKMAAGLMQLMPETAARLGVRDRFDPGENVRGGAAYLRMLLNTFRGDLTLALAAYNAGETAVLTHGGIPPYAETANYVATVKRLCNCDQSAAVALSE